MVRRVVLILAAVPLFLLGEIVLLQPAQDEVISGVDPLLRSFWNMPRAERQALFSARDYRKKISQVRDAVPYTFKWKCTAGENGTFRVVVAEDADFKKLVPVMRYVSEKGKSVAGEEQLVNFISGRICYWRVECQLADGSRSFSQSSRFAIDPEPPRLMNLPNVGNVRDLGGYIGVEGRKIRQGMIYRAAGLNENSPDHKNKKGGKTDPATFAVGVDRITPESVAYLREVLGVRVDLDLRGEGEVGSMKESPAGAQVRWIHQSSLSYGDIYGKDGSCTGFGPDAMAKNFRVFCQRENYPVLFHCIYGSSRTGSLAFVLCGVLGVDMDTLIKDCEISGADGFNYKQRTDALEAGVMACGNPDAPLHERFEAYLKRIGITAEEIATFRTIMLE